MRREMDETILYSSHFLCEIENRLMTGINIVITFNYDMNQLGVNDSFRAIFTFIRALSGNIFLIGAKSTLIF